MITEFRVLIYCKCTHEHRQHDTRNGKCEGAWELCPCNGFRGSHIIPEGESWEARRIAVRTVPLPVRVKHIADAHNVTGNR